MTRTEPSTGRCEHCGTPVIDAQQYGGHVTRLDAKPVADGPYRAFYSTRGYWACAQVTIHDALFAGMRRREHTCASYQMELA